MKKYNLFYSLGLSLNILILTTTAFADKTSDIYESELEKEISIALKEVRPKKIKKKIKKNFIYKEASIKKSPVKITKALKKPSKIKNKIITSEKVYQENTSIKIHKTIPKNSETEKSKKWGLNLFTYVNTANVLESNDEPNSYDRNSYNQNDEYQLDPGLGLGLEHSMDVFSFEAFHIGYQVGATYDFKRPLSNLNNTNLQINDYYQNSNSLDLALLLPFFNLTTRYKVGYIFGGVNYSVPQLNSNTNQFAEGKPGFQVGLGSQIGNWISVELSYRSIALSIEDSYYNTHNINENYFNQNTYYPTYNRTNYSEERDFFLNGFSFSLKGRF